MKHTLKTIVTATVIACSGGMLMGTYTPDVVAAETAAGVNKAIADVTKALEEALQIAMEGTDPKALLEKLGEAKQAYKEITGDVYGASLQRLSGYIRRARGMARRGDLAGAEEHIKKALEVIKRFPKA